MSPLKKIDDNQEEHHPRRKPVASVRDAFFELKERIQDKLVAELDPAMDVSRMDEVRRTIHDMFEQILAQENIILSRSEHKRLFEGIVAEILGFGPLEVLMADENVSEIMVNGPDQVFVERKGKLTKTNLAFEDDKHLLKIIDRIFSPLGGQIDENSPYGMARLPDGSRFSAIVPPLASDGPALVIRKFEKDPLTIDDLIRFGSMSSETAEFLKACVKARLNIIVSGNTGSGKTTLLNVLSSFIPNDERIITVEEAAELQLRQEHVVTLESSSKNSSGQEDVTSQDLVANCMRMRPDRMVLGELTQYMFKAIVIAANLTDGVFTTIQADSLRDAINRLERRASEECPDLPLSLLRNQIAESFDLIIQQNRLQDGSRKVVAISEVLNIQGPVIALQDIFVFEQQGVENGKIIGRLKPTGYWPSFLDRIRDFGSSLPPNLFHTRFS